MTVPSAAPAPNASTAIAAKAVSPAFMRRLACVKSASFPAAAVGRLDIATDGTIWAPRFKRAELEADVHCAACRCRCGCCFRFSQVLRLRPQPTFHRAERDAEPLRDLPGTTTPLPRATPAPVLGSRPATRSGRGPLRLAGRVCCSTGSGARPVRSAKKPDPRSDLPRTSCPRARKHSPTGSSPGSWAPPVDQIDKTYGHLLPDSLDRTRSALDAFVQNGVLAEEGGGHLQA